MPVFSTAVLIGIAATAAVVGTVSSIKAQKKAGKAQAAQQSNQRRRSARQNIRQAQLARAQAMAGAEGAGSGGSSGAAGGIGSIGSRLGGALGHSSQQSNLSQIVSKQNQRAATWSGVAQLGSQAFSALGGFGAMGSGKAPDLGVGADVQ